MIPADVITCVTAFSASPGDKLLVVNGVCIGVEKCSVEDAILDHTTPVRVIGAPTQPKTKPVKPKRGPPFKGRPKKNNPTVDEVLTHVSHKPVTSMQIADALSIPRAATTLRSAVGRRLKKLVEQGLVTYTRDPRGAHALGVYTLVGNKDKSNVSG
jgi:hypothetical protein